MDYNISIDYRNISNNLKYFMECEEKSVIMSLDMKNKKHFSVTCAHIMFLISILYDWPNNIENVDYLDLEHKDTVNRFKDLGMRFITLVCTCILFYDLIHEDGFKFTSCQKRKKFVIMIDNTSDIISPCRLAYKFLKRIWNFVSTIIREFFSWHLALRFKDLGMRFITLVCTCVLFYDLECKNRFEHLLCCDENNLKLTIDIRPDIISPCHLAYKFLSRIWNFVSTFNREPFTWYSVSSSLPEQSLLPLIPISDPSSTSDENKSNHPYFVSRLLTDFTEVKKIGFGGQGEVYKAKNNIDNLTYAIKKIPRLNGQKKMKAALREARALANLDHKNIVRYSNAWTEKPPLDWIDPHKNLSTSKSDFTTTSSNDLTNSDDSDEQSKSSCENIYLYIQTEWCQNGNLREWLDENSDISIREKNYMSIFKQILNAVEYIHKKGMMHRDLKPSNIFLSIDGKIKIGDFGLVGTIREHKGCIGTELYMSPEQLERKTYNFKVDIWSLALIFFELLYPMNTEMERIRVFQSLRKQKYPAEFKIKYPNEYSLISLMMSPNPDKRPTTSELIAHSPFSHQTDYK